MATYDALSLSMDTMRRASQRNGKLYIATCDGCQYKEMGTVIMKNLAVTNHAPRTFWSRLGLLVLKAMKGCVSVSCE